MPLADYLYLNGRPIATLTPSGTLYFLHDDMLGTPQLATDSSQNIAWQATYTAFGKASVSGTLTQNLRLPGQYYDSEGGWNHNGFRNYLPDLGRYIEPDPLAMMGSARYYDPNLGGLVSEYSLGLASGTVSFYAYAADDPQNLFDPFGLCWIYSQSTGILTHVDANGTVDYTATGGYSGYGAGLNNPAMQRVRAQEHGDTAGPFIPQGTYLIGPAYHNPRTGPMTMNLNPTGGTNTFGRDYFRAHGDKRSKSYCIYRVYSRRSCRSKADRPQPR